MEKTGVYIKISLPPILLEIATHVNPLRRISPFPTADFRAKKRKTIKELPLSITSADLTLSESIPSGIASIPGAYLKVLFER